MDAAPVKPTGITHDAAARLVGIPPGELEKLVSSGLVRRNDRNSYSVPVLVGDYADYLRTQDEKHPTQSDLAIHLDLSDRSIRELEQKLNLPPDYSRAAFRVAYLRNLREVAAGRASQVADSLDLAAERAALAKAQRVGQEIKNAVAQGEFAPVGLLGDVLAAASAAVVDRFDGLPGQLRKACPDLPAEAREAIEKTIASARNEWIRSSAELAIARMDELADTGDEADLFDAEDAPP